MTRLIPVAAAVLVLLFSGLVHGLWTDRWADGLDLQAAAAKLEAIPTVLGEWKAVPSQHETSKASGLTGSVTRQYVHAQSGQMVTVFLGCGRPGPVSIHTPDVCYAASGYEEGQRKEYVIPAGTPAAGASFFTADFRKTKAADKTQLRIYWSWHASDQWVVAHSPRIEFVREPVLYKLYVLREVASGEAVAEEPCVELMKQLLPALDRTILSPS